MKYLTRAIFIAALAILSSLSLLLAPLIRAASVSQGYSTVDSRLKVGMSASLSPDSTPGKQLVEAASTDNGSKFVGIVTTVDSSLLTETDKNSKIYVTSQGQTSAFASDVNGQIKKGDFLALSPLRGIVMRANSDQSLVVGTALEDFSQSGATSEDVTNINGTHRTVLVNTIKLNISPHNLTGINSQPKSFLVVLGQALTGKEVNPWQVISALVIFFILLIVEGSIVYGAARSSLIALGRNPLAKKAVYKQLIQVGVLVLVILAFGMASIYAVLIG